MSEEFQLWKTQFGRTLGAGGIVLRGWSFNPERMELVGRIPAVSQLRTGELVRGWADWLDFVHPEDRADLDARFKRCLLQSGAYELEYRLSGDSKVVSVKEQGMVYQGPKQDLRSVVAVIRDVTEVMELETRLSHSRKMESFGQLAGGVAHDFNNMLAVILGYSQMVLDDLKPGDAMLPYVQEIEGAAQRAASLTNQLLAFTRQEIHETHILGFDEVLTEMGKMLRRLSGELVQMRVEAGAGAEGLLRVDRNQIEQLLIHLSVCARDLLPRGGFFTLKTLLLKPEEPPQTKGNEDDEPSGLAIHGRLLLVAECHQQPPDRDLTVLGEEVSWSNDLTALNTCESIIKDNHGEIRHSGYGEVTKGLAIFFPLARAISAGTTTTAPEAEPEVVQGSVLLVEDDPGVRKLSRLILNRLGHQVIEAENGTTGWLAFQAGLPQGISLVVSDMIMPGMGGLELGRKILAKSPTTPLLFMSGYANQQRIIADAGLRGTHGFLRKPFSVEEFSTKVREILHGQ